MQIYRRRIYMTKLEELYNKVKQSDVDAPTDEWAKTVTLDEACEGSVILKRNRLWAIKTDCHKYYIGLLEDHICDTMDINKIASGTRIRHKDTGKMYVVYQTKLNTVENVMNGDCYLYTTTTGDVFTNKEVESLSLIDTVKETSNDLKSLKVGDIITYYNYAKISTSLLVIDISDGEVTFVEVKGSRYVCGTSTINISDESITPLYSNGICDDLDNLGHRLINVSGVYDEGYDREIGICDDNISNMYDRLSPEIKTLTIDLGNINCSASLMNMRAKQLVVPVNNMFECFVSRGIDIRSLRKTNIHIKEIDARSIYRYLKSDKDEDIVEIYHQLMREEEDRKVVLKYYPDND